MMNETRDGFIRDSTDVIAENGLGDDPVENSSRESASKLRPESRRQIPIGRLVLLVNNFVVQTVGFLNDFGKKCESRLFDVSVKIAKTEALLGILEAKLASIPDLTDLTTPVTSRFDETKSAPSQSVLPAQPQSQTETQLAPTVSKHTETPLAQEQPSSNPVVSLPPVSNGGNSRVPEKYLKLLKLGMPKEHIQVKMESEGFDPKLLDGTSDYTDTETHMESIAPPAPDLPKAQPALPLLESTQENTPPPESNASLSELLVDETKNEPPESPADAHEETTILVALKDDPTYSKYFRMLRMGIPKPSVQQKMQMDGLDPTLLDRDPASASPNDTQT